MAIRHADTKVSGDRGYASEWNKDHTIDAENIPRRSTTLIVAASDSQDQDRADYVCDGTADEAEISTAINDLPASGGRVMLLEGNYTLSSRMEFLKSNVELVGQGTGTIITGSGNYQKLYATGKSHLLVSNMKIIGNAGGILDNGVYFTGCTYCRVVQTYITNCDKAGINLVNGARNKIIDNLLLSNTGDGISFNGEGNSLIADNIVMSNDEGIYLQNGEENTVSNNQVLANLQNGIKLNFEDDTVIIVNTCADNDVNNTASFDGIRLTSSDNNVITGNRCKDNDRYEINIDGAASDKNIVVANNLIGTDHVGALNDAGTATEDAHNVVA